MISLEDLADLELLLPLPGTAFRDELDAVTRPLGITLIPGAEIDGIRLIASLTFEGTGRPSCRPPPSPRSSGPASTRYPSTGSPGGASAWPNGAGASPPLRPGRSHELLNTVVAQPEGRPEGVHVAATS